MKKAKIIQTKVNNFRDEIQKLTKSKEQIEKFGKNNMNLIENLKNSIEFLSS
jgi:hypothetical protein